MDHGYVLDSGALIAVEKSTGNLRKKLDHLRRRNTPVLVSAGVVAQVWWDTPRQAPLSALLKLRSVDVVPLTYEASRLVDRLLKKSGTRDAVDAHVALLAFERKWPVFSSVPGGLRILCPEVRIEHI
ncbi:MAG: PIN domain-containing protein [Nocardiopsaceae bacterium]|nr:PIN domain-containing protein [Nocardiopsaceae bacterium]